MIDEMTGAAGLARDAQIAGIDEADELGALAVQQRICAFRRGAARKVPVLGKARRDMGALQRGAVLGRLGLRVFWFVDLRIAAMAIGAAQHHGGVGMHGGEVGADVTTVAAGALGVGLGLGLVCGRGRGWRIGYGARRFCFRREQRRHRQRLPPGNIASVCVSLNSYSSENNSWHYARLNHYIQTGTSPLPSGEGQGEGNLFHSPLTPTLSPHAGRGSHNSQHAQYARITLPNTEYAFSSPYNCLKPSPGNSTAPDNRNTMFWLISGR